MLTEAQKEAIQEKANRLGFLHSERLVLLTELNGLVSTIKADGDDEVCDVSSYLYCISDDAKVAFDEFRQGSRYTFWMPSTASC